MNKLVSAALLIVTLLALAACGGTVNRVMDTADRAGDAFGEAVGQRVGQVMAARFPDTWNAQYMQLYAGYLFNVAFHAGSYAPAGEDYEPGEWTRWSLEADEAEGRATVERAFLARTDEGDEWWRVRYGDADTDEAIVLEGLFSPDREELLRLRARFPGEEAREMPVEEGTYGYARPVRLTEESIEGATVGREQIQVPAGTFEARHVRYGDVGGTLEWWLHDEVPGGMVRYLHRADDGAADDETMPESYVVELTGYGDGATSELGVI